MALLSNLMRNYHNEKSLLILISVFSLAFVSCDGTQDNHSITLNKRTLELDVN